ncbi:competence/damage-inducible protein A [Priestia taiwanensis]|uniref:Putative competence-damage inducible protein n=1 Tax=Priestia taiwanensis TaxID=1347902 RepID=A0A917APF5_9BACI|nr:competence/damage-inducible protein A [Priestia taiwanensis]MBM7362772.1 nicotinamide-nucleotide amidase [Priestia taiwanensis]GGE64977.1 putative competence-damage inducible protein [Priestia taiwanensis]
MNVEIIAVGTELLLGQIANTNAQYISRQLATLGHNCYYHTVVGDNKLRLRDAISTASKRADILLFTGGLGPTEDDITKETIAEFCQTSLIYHEESLRSIESFFQVTNRVITENNKKQALVLDGATVFMNHHGMAPGMAKEVNGTLFILLPGPPKEMIPMFDQVRDYFMQTYATDGYIRSKVLRFFGIGEAALETALLDLIKEQTNPTIAPLAGDGEVTIRLTAKHKLEDEANHLLEEMEQQIRERVGTYVYGYNDETLASKVIELLQQRGYTLASAESLTGGLFGDSVTAYSGVSSIYKGGIVCYSNESKEQLLHVPKEVLEHDGAVSERCAAYLAKNVREQFNTTVGISFTGIAGPTSVEGKPVGTVFIGISVQGKEEVVHSLKIAGTREQIKLRAVKHGLYHILRKLEE